MPLQDANPTPSFGGFGLKEALEIIAAHPRAWLFINGCMMIAIAITVAGFALLTDLLKVDGSRTLSELRLTAFLLGGALGLASWAFRVSTMASAAKETAASSSIPVFYEPLHGWMGMLFSMYSILAYLSIAADGGALIRTEYLPLWLGWTSLAFGPTWALGSLARMLNVRGTMLFNVPLLIHVMPALMGVFLLVRDS